MGHRLDSPTSGGIMATEMPTPSRMTLPETQPIGFETAVAESTSRANAYSPMQGIRCWVNEGNGFAVFELHYTADSKKRGEAWISREEKKYGGRKSASWRRNMELDFSVRGGELVFPEFVPSPRTAFDSHVIVPNYPIPSWWTRRRGIDPASVNPFAVAWWARSPEGIHFCYDELYVRNAWELAKETPMGRLTGINAMKYLIHEKSRGQKFEGSIIDPSAKSKSIRAGGTGFGPESARANLLEDMEANPYPIQCRPYRRTGAEYLDVERMRATLFQTKRYRHLSAETLAILNIEYNPAGYDLFGGYFFVNCMAHIYEFKNLRWAEVFDDLVNRSEEIEDADNHTWDAGKYALLEPWDNSVKPRPDAPPVADSRKYTAHYVNEYMREQAAELAKQSRRGRSPGQPYMEAF